MLHAIELSGVSKQFQDFKAVDHLSFSVKQGDIYGFLGPNGSGKSTTLRMIMGLIKPSAGEITMFGMKLNEHRSDIMQRIGCIIEKPDFYTYLSAKENLSLCVRASGLKYTSTQYDDLFALVGLKGREGDKVKTYSHGMKQRLGLAQALLHDPDLIILDEPNTGLDPQGIIDLRNLILQLNQERGKTILLSSHILSEVQEICTSMIVINKGKTVAQGNVSELLSHEELHVTLELNDTNNSKSILYKSKYSYFILHEHEGCYDLKLSKQQIPVMIADLTRAGAEVLRIDYRNQLEDYFLKITANS
jgi:ABC-type multidrug transport system ATPase subunit